MISIQVSSDSPHYLVQAKELSSVLGYPLVTDIGSPDDYQNDPSYVLLVGEDGLSHFLVIGDYTGRYESILCSALTIIGVGLVVEMAKL